jgi:hypothetical protein
VWGEIRHDLRVRFAENKSNRSLEATSGRGNIQIRRTGILSGYLVRMRAASA